MIRFFNKSIPALTLFSFLVSIQAHSAPTLTFNTEQNHSIEKNTANAYLEIDTKAFGNNLEVLKKHLQGKAKICAILKADAYGNGINNLMPTLISHDITCIGITSNEEARIARMHNYKGTIMRVRNATLAEIQNGTKYDIEELFGSINTAIAANDYARQQNKNIRFHLALNSAGMNRNGIDISTDTGKTEALKLTKLSNLKIVGIMTHFPVEDTVDIAKGLNSFKTDSHWLIKTAKLDRSKLTLHAANSFATLEVPQSWLDMVRPGGIIYGEPVYNRPEYQYIMSFKTRVASINFYPKGSTVGYDRTYTLTRDSYLANLPIGYSDGYRRAFSNKGHVLVSGQRVPVVGKISMNTTMIDITDIHDKVNIGDEVVLFGKQGNNEITQAEVEEINGALLADLYTIWGNSNPKFNKE